MKKYIPLFIFTLILVLSSCTKILNDFEFKDVDPKLVIQAKFNADTTTRILITRSLDMYDRREIKEIADATVSLIMGDGGRISCRHDSGGWYSLSSGYIQAEGTYQLQAEKEGFPTAVSSFFIPAAPVVNRIDTSTVRELAGPYGGTYIRGKLTIYLNDNPATEDFYIISVMKNYQYFIYNDFGLVVDTNVYTDYIYCSSASPFVELTWDTWEGYVDWKSESERYGSAMVLSDKYFNGGNNVAVELLFDPMYDDRSWEEDPVEDYLYVYVKAVDMNLFEYARAQAEISKTLDNPLAEPVTPFSSVQNGYGLVYGESLVRIPVDITDLFADFSPYYEY